MHPQVRRMWFSFALTAVGLVALAALGDWLLAAAALALLWFNLRTIRTLNRRLAERPPRDD
jgi:hypothetical protein